MEQSTARVRSKRMGLAVATYEFGRKADAVSDAPDRRAELCFRQLDPARWHQPADRLRRGHDDAEKFCRDRKPQAPHHLGHCDSNARTEDRMRPAERGELDGHELSLLGGARQL